MKEKPKLLHSEIAYKGWLEVRVDKFHLPGRKDPYPYDIVKIGNGVAVLPFLDEETLLLAEQYRPPVDNIVLELIQGGINRGESIEDAAVRELREETGYSATIQNIGMIYPLPGSLEMQLYIVKATNLCKSQEPELKPEESLTLVTKPYQQVLEEVLAGKHPDSALSWAVLYHEVKHSQSSLF